LFAEKDDEVVEHTTGGFSNNLFISEHQSVFSGQKN